MGEWHAGALSVHIDESVMDAIYAARDAAVPREVGGLLFGTYLDSCSIRVSDVIMCASGGLCDFERTPPDPNAVESLWDRDIYFVGDWHSHPGSSPHPSSTDIATMLETANDPAAKCPAPIMLIVGDWDSLTGVMNGEFVFFDSSEAPTKAAKELKAEHKIKILDGLDEATNEANEVETWTARIKPIDGVSSHRETGVVGGLTYPTDVERQLATAGSISCGPDPYHFRSHRGQIFSLLSSARAARSARIEETCETILDEILRDSTGER